MVVDYNHAQQQEYKYVMQDLLYLDLLVHAQQVKQLHQHVIHVYHVHQIVLIVQVQHNVQLVQVHIQILMEHVHSLAQQDNMYLPLLVHQLLLTQQPQTQLQLTQQPQTQLQLTQLTQQPQIHQDY